MKSAPPAEQVIFAGGPPTKVQTWVGLIKDSQPHLVHRALIAIMLMRVPLAVLTGIRGDLIGMGAGRRAGACAAELPGPQRVRSLLNSP